MTVDLLATPSRRFVSADRAAQPADGMLLIGQLLAVASLLGGLVLSLSDRASPWQALLGGAGLLALTLVYRRGDDDRQARLACLLWLALPVAAVVMTGPLHTYSARDPPLST